MKRNTVFGMTAVSLAAWSAAPAEAGKYRILFRGNEALATQSAAIPSVRPAGYIGLPPATAVATAVPAAATLPPPVIAVPPATVVPAAAVAIPAGPACATCVPPTTPNHGAGVPNQIVTFLHPYTNKAVTIPLTLPTGKPTIVTKSDRIIYDYGLFNYKVVVRFLPDGLVDVKYKD